MLERDGTIFYETLQNGLSFAVCPAICRYLTRNVKVRHVRAADDVSTVLPTVGGGDRSVEASTATRVGR